MIGFMNKLNAFACYNKDNNIRKCSSSGAIFYSLSKYVLENKGIVYGVTMTNDCYQAEFTRVVEISEIKKLLGSKYLQAKLGDTFLQVKKDLLSEKLVLFSGTACQVNGLKNFLGKDYENLICIDVICHGVPSPALWKKYVQYQEEDNLGKLKYISFRCKDVILKEFKYDDLKYCKVTNESKYIYIPKTLDSYMQMFLRDYCLRPSCYKCIAKENKMSDLSIADFWGVNKVVPKMNDGKGTDRKSVV